MGAYIVAAQPSGATYTLRNNIIPQGVSIPLCADTLVSIGAQPLIVAATLGQGRAVQWTSYAWMHVDVFGYVHGFDDLIWRGLVWAARKPFVMQGLPPFVTMRVDDVTGPFDWVDAANSYGYKPWLGIFMDSVLDIPHLKQLVDTGGATVSIHSRTSENTFYFDHSNQQALPDQVVAQNYADGFAWHTRNQIPDIQVYCTALL